MCANSVITVSGLPGSGTSTVCELVAQATGFRYINAAAIFRELAGEDGLSLAEFGRRAEGDAQVDRRLDDRMAREAAQEDGGVILEGRVTGWMSVRYRQDALKVWLKADIGARATRVAGREGQSPEDARLDIEHREQSEGVRYATHYGIDIGDLSPYDLVIDSVEYTPSELAERIVAALTGADRRD